jgi:hypothetical protein
MIVLLAAAISLAQDSPPRPRPAALVLDLRGRVELQPVAQAVRPARIGDLIYAEERFLVPEGGSASLALLRLGVIERLKPGVEVTIGPDGCSPRQAVEQRSEQRPPVARTLRNIRPQSEGGRQAGVVFRSHGDRFPAITPIFGATVATDRPDLAWPEAKPAGASRVRLLTGSGRELWKAESRAARLAFPKDKEPLRRGYVYHWEVTDQDFRPIASGEFTVATASELEQMEGLRSLAASPDRADRLAAALSYRRLACFAEAIATFEALLPSSPEEPFYRTALADLYRQAGRVIDPPAAPGAGPGPRSGSGAPGASRRPAPP